MHVAERLQQRCAFDGYFHADPRSSGKVDRFKGNQSGA
jgi:hypothetical protein